MSKVGIVFVADMDDDENLKNDVDRVLDAIENLGFTAAAVSPQMIVDLAKQIENDKEQS